jgi:hypothetical protein
MYELKKIKAVSIPRALQKAERYRLLNEPRCAESICRDVLAVEENNPDAIRILILAITDQFTMGGERTGMRERKEDVDALLGRLPDEYSQLYYKGVMLERWAKGLLKVKSNPATIHDFLVEAMEAYEAAEAIFNTDNQDAELRWNTCARIIMRYGLASRSEKPVIHHEWFDDEVPRR